jgi:cytochrome c556
VRMVISLVDPACMVVLLPSANITRSSCKCGLCCYTRARSNPTNGRFTMRASMRKTAVLTFVAAALATAVASAAVKPETAIHYRQSVYTMIGWNFAPMVGMIKDKTPWDSAEFAKRADRIASLAPQLLEGFPEGSDKGAETEAKPEIWKNMDDFKSKMNDLVRETKALADVAKAGDEAKTREQFKKTAGACKSCHDKYRSEE